MLILHIGGDFTGKNVQNGEDIPLNSYHQIMTLIENIGIKIKERRLTIKKHFSCDFLHRLNGIWGVKFCVMFESMSILPSFSAKFVYFLVYSLG